MSLIRLYFHVKSYFTPNQNNGNITYHPYVSRMYSYVIRMSLIYGFTMKCFVQEINQAMCRKNVAYLMYVANKGRKISANKSITILNDTLFSSV